MDKELFKILKDLRDERRNRKINPDYIPFNKLPEREGLRDALNEAYKEGYIKVHRGLNYNLIELVRDEI
jgi:hypothetical protein